MTAIPHNASNIPSPDPSLATNERLAHAIEGIEKRIDRAREETKGWVDALQILEERERRAGDVLLDEKVVGGLRNIGTRLDGNDTALVAALKAQKEEAATQTKSFKEILDEIKTGIEKQFDSMGRQINELKERMSESGGWSKGSGQTITLIVAIVAAIAAVVSAIIVLSRTDYRGPQTQHTLISGAIKDYE